MSGTDHYREIYRRGLEVEARWLDMGAANKVDTIEQFLPLLPARPRVLVELGCGTGAVIGECMRRGIADEYTAIDSSREAIDEVARTLPGVRSICADIRSDSFSSPDDVDLLVLTHVLEHLEEPERLLASLSKVRFRHCVVEVPLEDLPLARVRSIFKDRRRSEAGHVQFFKPQSVERLLTDAGLQILGRRTYVPVLSREELQFLRVKNGWSHLRFGQSIITGRLLPLRLGRLWGAFYYAHHGLLCTPSESEQV